MDERHHSNSLEKKDKNRKKSKQKKSRKRREKRNHVEPVITIQDEKKASKLFLVGSAVFLVFLLGVSFVSIFSDGLIYIPSINAQDYAKGDVVQLSVNRIVSEHVPIPFRYSELPTCPVDPPPSIESLGDVLLGNRNDVAQTELKMHENVDCAVMCEDISVSADDVDNLRRLISEDYKVEWFIDNLPVAAKYLILNGEESETTYLSRYPLGFEENEEILLFNHFDLKIYTNEVKEEIPLSFSDEETEEVKYNVVFVEVELQSYNYNKKPAKCSGPKLLLNEGKETSITYSYSVQWIPDTTEWTERWNRYMDSSEKNEIHWFAILNSILIVLFLSGIIITILSRTIYRDISRYNSDDPELREETGWKQVSGDIFRPPARSGLLAVMVGSGAQISAMTFLTISFALLGFLSPANRGGVITALIILFVWLGILSGYVATWTLRVMGRDQNWQVVRRNSILTGFFIPGVIFALFFFLNLFLSISGSSSATPFFTFIAVIALWIFISVPLCLIGSFLSYRRPDIELPVSVNLIARAIVDQEIYMHPIVTFLLGGILPFGSVFIEFSSILNSIWHQQYYFLFGYLYLVFILLLITCSEVAIVIVYFQLCYEDYRWWWRSYLTGCATGFYAFLYAIYYFISQLQLDGLVSIILFVGYSLIMAIGIGSITGTFGFFSSYLFINKIYSEIHVK
eukprot:TRINITY_DN3272_c0_g1_i1.p1 TRINITY_DN3272_c0_g1~~TRINITY_DN3272_c0_g1_i1.p1  ORF type:complete len:684 (+),score=138.16 TRINITY_DN3272_c0_g1_i1:43-2094(+)